MPSSGLDAQGFDSLAGAHASVLLVRCKPICLMPINFDKLMSRNPFEYDRMLNSKGQVILFLESPTRGDEAPVICACPELGLAAYSDFFETDDMLADHGEYEPWFSEKGTLKFGELGDPNE